MIKKILAMGLLSLAVMTSALANQHDAQQLQSKLAELNTFQADFMQRMTQGTHHVTTVSGRVRLIRPGRFRWDQESPVKKLIIADGHSIWVYDPPLEQAIRKPERMDAQHFTPITLLSSSAQTIATHFFVAQDDNDCFILKPKNDESSLDEINLCFENDALSVMKLKDKLDHVTTITFTDIDVNEPVSKDQFVFIPPPGTDIIDEDQ